MWFRSVWRAVDDRLANLSRSLQRVVRTIRIVRALLVVAVLLVIATAVTAFFIPIKYFPIIYAVGVGVLVIPVVALAFLVGLPLRARSAVRLIDKGYPENAKEIAIRVAAHKLHDESIESEELLVDTAVNEAKKIARRVRERRADEAATSRARERRAETHGGHVSVVDKVVVDAPDATDDAPRKAAGKPPRGGAKRRGKKRRGRSGVKQGQ